MGNPDETDADAEAAAVAEKQPDEEDDNEQEVVANAAVAVTGRLNEPNDVFELAVAVAAPEDNDGPLPLRPSATPVGGGISSELPKACFKPSSLELPDAADETAAAAAVDGAPLC